MITQPACCSILVENYIACTYIYKGCAKLYNMVYSVPHTILRRYWMVVQPSLSKKALIQLKENTYIFTSRLLKEALPKNVVIVSYECPT